MIQLSYREVIKMQRKTAYYIDPELQRFVIEESRKRRMTQSALVEYLIAELKLEVEGKKHEDNRN